jgi:hypothetical protein
MKRALAAAVLAAARLLAASHPAAPVHRHPVAVAAHQPPSWLTLFRTWRDGGLADLQAVSKASDTDSHTLAAAHLLSQAAMARLATAAASFQVAAQTAQQDPAPVCVTGLRTDEGAAMASYNRAAQGELNLAQAAGGVPAQQLTHQELTCASGRFKNVAVATFRTESNENKWITANGGNVLKGSLWAALPGGITGGASSDLGTMQHYLGGTVVK